MSRLGQFKIAHDLYYTKHKTEGHLDSPLALEMHHSIATFV